MVGRMQCPPPKVGCAFSQASVPWPNDADRSAIRTANGSVGGDCRRHRRGHLSRHLSHACGDGAIAGLSCPACGSLVRYGRSHAGRRALLYGAWPCAIPSTAANTSICAGASAAVWPFFMDGWPRSSCIPALLRRSALAPCRISKRSFPFPPVFSRFCLQP